MRTDAFRWSVLVIVLAVASSVVYNKYLITRPCAQPIPYTIGAVDPKFGITNATLLSDIEAAAAIWNKAEGKTLLSYQKNSPYIKINLVYDKRQVGALEDVDIARQIDEANRARVALQALQSSRLQSPESITAQVKSYNENVAVLNAKIQEYNKTAGYDFVEGRNTQGTTGDIINIYAFVSDTQLVRVLAHEFGHALGLGHNNDPASIMFAKNESGNLVPTVADLAALKALCGA